METKKTTGKKVLCILLIAALCIGAGAFGLGYYCSTAKYNAERDSWVSINRSELEGLGKIEGKIYVTGHKSPDSDTVCSSIAYANLLRELGYDAEAVVLGAINHESQYILEQAGLECPRLLESAAGENIVLVDHSEFLQSAPDLEGANIISIIDHHAVGSVTTSGPIVYDARPIGATATIVWIRYQNYGVELTPQMAKILLGALLSDTNNLTSNTMSADREAYKALSKRAGITDVDAFYQEMYKNLINYDGMTDVEILFHDYKEYESEDKHFGIGAIDVYDEDAAKDMAERMKNLLPLVLPSTGMDAIYTHIVVKHDDLDVSYLVPCDEAASELAATAFENAVFDGTSYVFRPGASRKKDIAPGITDVIAAYPTDD